jgi:hypothetical protein
MIGVGTSLLKALTEALLPLSRALDDSTSFTLLLSRLGWTAELEEDDVDLIRSALALDDLVSEATRLVDALEDPGADETALAASILEATGKIIERVFELATNPPEGLPAPLDDPTFWAEVPESLLDFLLSEYLQIEQPALYAVLTFLDVIAIEHVEPTGSTRIPFDRISIDWSKLGSALRDLPAYVRSLYGWDTSSTFDYGRFLTTVEQMFLVLRHRVRRSLPRESLVSEFFGEAGPPSDLRELVVPLLSGCTPDGQGFAELGILLLPIPASPGESTPSGFLLTSVSKGAVDLSFPLGPEFDVTFSGGFASDGAVRVRLYPGSASAESDLEGSAIDAGIDLVGVPREDYWLLLGEATGPRVQLTGCQLSFAVSGTVDDPELVIIAGTGDGELSAIIEPGDGDGFLRAILGEESLSFSMAAEIQWSSKSGISFAADGGITINIPIDQTIGPVLLSTVSLSLLDTDQGIELVVGISASVTLGPLEISMDGVGFGAELVSVSEGDPPGIFGSLDTALAFRAPTGLGLALDTGVVSGGGYLSFDADEQTYAGVVELGFLNLDLQAYGLITTSLPDGSDGWSMVIFISTSFAPIPIGFGFFLEAVGGMFGYNRSANTDVLQAGIREGTLDSILFPDDPVANAVQILSDLEAVFPATEGQYLFGPMAKIGWPTPSLLDVDLAIILEAPDPMRVLVLGQIAVEIPSQEPIIELHVDVVGILDLDLGTLSIDASLYDSSVATYSLNGQMALRLGWGGNPEFALAVGGFNPGYVPPDDIGALDRVSISLDTDNPLISLEGYFALTSNTVQFGADMALSASAVGFTIEGSAGFDVLIVFSPFGFEADIFFAMVIRAGSITLAGVDLELEVTGPQPWEVDGEVTFKLLLLKKTFSVHLTLGKDEAPALAESIDVASLLEAALAVSSNWTSVLGNDEEVGVTFAARYDDVVLVHPAGGVEFRQSVVPLNVLLDFYSGQSIEGSTSFVLGLSSLGGASVSSEDWSAVEDWFAPGLYFEMSDPEQLASPDYELMTAGLGIGTTRVLPGAESELGLTTSLEYESFVVHPDADSVDKGRKAISTDELQHFCASSATASAQASGVGSSRFQGKKTTLRVVDTPYVVAGTNDLAMASAGGIAAKTKTTYHEALRAINSEADASELQIVPFCEVAEKVA